MIVLCDILSRYLAVQDGSKLNTNAATAYTGQHAQRQSPIVTCSVSIDLVSFFEAWAHTTHTHPHTRVISGEKANILRRTHLVSVG